MRSRVSYRFQIDSSYTCGRTKTMRKRYDLTRIFLKTGEKSFVFKRIRIRVDRALVGAIQRQRNVQKKCAARAKFVFFAI